MVTNYGTPVASFLEYEKISDTLLYFSSTLSLRSNVFLAKRDRNDRRMPYHVEYRYSTDRYADAAELISLKRDLRFCFSIEDSTDLRNGVMLHVQDVVFLRLLIEKNIFPWYMGARKVFGKHPDTGMIIVNGTYEPQQLVISEVSYLGFVPIAIEYETEHNSIYGIRMTMNRPDNFVDMPLDKFMQFYYFIAHTDMYNAACCMLNYVKMQPYGVNLKEIRKESNRFLM